MEIEVEFTRDELYRAMKAVSLSSFGQFKSTGTYKMLVGLSILAVLGIGASALTFIHNSMDYDYFSFMLIIILFVGYTLIFRFITAEFARFIVYNSKRYSGPVKYKLDDRYLYVQDRGITSRFQHGSFCKVEDTKEFTLLYIDIHQAVIIPKKDEKSIEMAAFFSRNIKHATTGSA